MKHYCSSCDEYVYVDELDNYGRCENCQIEYGDIKEGEDNDVYM